MGVLLKNATMLNGKKADILTEGNKIAKISGKITDKAEFKIDATHRLAAPGLVNAHTHALGSGFRGIADDLPLNEWFEKHLWPAEDRLLNERFARDWSSIAMIEMIKSGTTAFVDLYSYQNEIADSAERIGMRAFVSEVVIDCPTKDYKEWSPEFAEKFLKKGNTELVTRLLGPHAIYTCSEEKLIKAREIASKYKAKLHIHLSETKKEVDDCVKTRNKRPAEYLESIGFLGNDVIAAHCTHVNTAEIEILKKRGVTPVINTTSNLKLASGVAPLPEMLKKDVNAALGTDGAASNNSLNMVQEMKTTALVHKGVTGDPTIVPAGDVFKMATENAYKALGINAGLRAGCLADVVLVDIKRANMVPHYSLLSNLVYAANGSEVTDAIINGKIVMKGRKMQNVDEKKLIDKLMSSA